MPSPPRRGQNCKTTLNFYRPFKSTRHKRDSRLRKRGNKWPRAWNGKEIYKKIKGNCGNNRAQCSSCLPRSVRESTACTYTYTGPVPSRRGRYNARYRLSLHDPRRSIAHRETHRGSTDLALLSVPLDSGIRSPSALSLASLCRFCSCASWRLRSSLASLQPRVLTTVAYMGP